MKKMIKDIINNFLDHLNLADIDNGIDKKETQKNLDLYEKLGIELLNNGIVVNSKNNQSSVENIFAVGDCCCFDGKISNIVMGFNDCLRCFYEICSLEHGKVDFYGHNK